MQLVFVSFKKKICNPADPTNPIAAGDIVSVRLRTSCYSCDVSVAGPNVPDVALGCSNLSSLDDNTEYVLLTQTPAEPCVGEVVDLVAETVSPDGRGFTFDRTLAGQDYRAEDIDMVMPDHDCLCDDGSSSIIIT
jgi:hypothetical protein